MNAYRENPDGEENQQATRENERYIGGLLLQQKLGTENQEGDDEEDTESEEV